MLKSQQKVDIKLSKIFQAIKNLASDKRSLHASLKLFTNLHLKTPARNCQRRFKLFVDLLDSLKQRTTGQLNIYDTGWLLQTVPGFADFAGVVEITWLNTREFLYYLAELYGNELVFAFSFVSSHNTDVETTEQFILLHTRYVFDFSGLTNFSQKL